MQARGEWRHAPGVLRIFLFFLCCWLGLYMVSGSALCVTEYEQVYYFFCLFFLFNFIIIIYYLKFIFSFFCF